MFTSRKMLVLAVGLGSLSLQSQAAFHVHDYSYSQSNDATLSGLLTPTSSVITNASSLISNSASTYFSSVTKAPTTSATGILTTYERHIATTTNTAAISADNVSYKVINTSANRDAISPYIRLMGSITADVATTINYLVTVNGIYQSVPGARNHPSVSPAPPYLEFYSGSSSAIAAGVSGDKSLDLSYTKPTVSNYKELSYSDIFKLAAGETQYFGIEVDPPSGSSVSDLDITFSGSNYGGQTQVLTPETDTQAILTSTIAELASSPSSNASASTVSAVPEPETYAMLLAGLAVLAAVARKKVAG